LKPEFYPRHLRNRWSRVLQRS